MASHWSIASMPAIARRRGRFVPSTRRITSPASSSTFRCCEIAGCVTWKGSASSITVASPLARRARMARRVGSAKAEKAASRLCIGHSLYKPRLIVKQNFITFMGNRGEPDGSPVLKGLAQQSNFVVNHRTSDGGTRERPHRSSRKERRGAAEMQNPQGSRPGRDRWATQKRFSEMRRGHPPKRLAGLSFFLPFFALEILRRGLKRNSPQPE